MAIIVHGVDVVKSPDALRSTLGYLPQGFGVYPNLSALEFLEYIAAIKGLDGKSARRRLKDHAYPVRAHRYGDQT